MPLLYHRMVTVFDMLVARAILDVAGIAVTMVILLLLATSLGYADLPARPLVLLAAVFLMGWFSFALSMIVCASTHENRLVARFVHPIIYIMAPLSGAFYQLEWLPEPYRTWMGWHPMVVIFEMARFGEFEAAPDRYIDGVYVTLVCLGLTYIGLLSVRIVRRHVHVQ